MLPVPVSRPVPLVSFSTAKTPALKATVGVVKRQVLRAAGTKPPHSAYIAPASVLFHAPPL